MAEPMAGGRPLVLIRIYRLVAAVGVFAFASGRLLRNLAGTDMQPPANGL